MTPCAALGELLARVGARPGAAATVNTEELNQWPQAAVSALKLQGLLLKARPPPERGMHRLRARMQHACAHGAACQRTGSVVCGV